MRMLEKIALKKIANDLGKGQRVYIKPEYVVATLKEVIPDIDPNGETKFMTILWRNSDGNLAKTLNAILKDNKEKD